MRQVGEWGFGTKDGATVEGVWDNEVRVKGKRNRSSGQKVEHLDFSMGKFRRVLRS